MDYEHDIVEDMDNTLPLKNMGNTGALVDTVNWLAIFKNTRVYW